MPALIAMLLAVLALPAHAGLYASLDRYSIALGDTVRLTLRSDGEADPAEADLSELEEDFEILQRSSSVSTRIVNGARSQNRELLLELTPRREGDVLIAPFEVDGERSEALAVTVSPPAEVEADDEIVTFEAEVDRDQVFVQGQLLLTLRVQQAVNLESRSITELDLENAYVETLGQNSFQRMINGRPWLVHEIRYAIFPEASGELVIPDQTFSGRMGSGRRTLFDTRPAGRLIRRKTDAITIPVLPRPTEFPDATWLPAADLSIEEQWSGDLDALQIGDSVTRTITISAKGLQGAQLPPVPATAIDGLRAYPDQPNINDVKEDAGVTGVRTDSVALVAVSDGEYELPPIEVPWWDTGSNTLRVARLPARRLRVLPNPGSATETPSLDDAARPPAQAPAAAPARAGAWPWIAAVCALGWLLTSFGWWRSRGQSASTPPTSGVTERRSPRALLQACRSGDAALARRELLAWLRGQGHRGPLSSWLRQQNSAALNQAVDGLEAALYRAGDDDTRRWDGSALAAAIESLEASPRRDEGDSGLPALYPGQ
ncbi:MAG: BatD family protein [Halieaceae bacterium]|jgi:hypothetical protein|nr:BatD family protein [Halieaceae bacterium]